MPDDVENNDTRYRSKHVNPVPAVNDYAMKTTKVGMMH